MARFTPVDGLDIWMLDRRSPHGAEGDRESDTEVIGPPGAKLDTPIFVFWAGDFPVENAGALW
jgi:hypothetical protein